MKKKILVIGLIAVIVCGSLFAGGTKDGAKDKRVFGYTYWAASDFFETIGQSIKEIAESNGDECIIIDAQQDNQRQLDIIDDFIVRGVDVVFLNPVDRDGIRPALLALREAGIPVVNFDTSVADLSLVASYIASDNTGAGRICAEALNKAFPQGGAIAILDYPANSACLDRTEGFKAAINSNFRIVAQQDAQGKPGPGLEKATDILTANPNLRAFFCVNDQSGMGAYGAVVEANANVLVYGVDGAPEAKQVIAQGTQYAGTAAQSPKQIGVKCAEVAYNILAGQPYDKEFYVPTFLMDINNAKDYLGFWQ
ncbi:sugar ABC transporter substrate-binding protein [Breznakiella homolactica]|uniref:Sugar ABC transporter substrate-binding protein n=1 Tax=Breznakiella homolactica TaxID=2798577 RepID=A0A7T7XNB3_9SPIR|nr:sugar ABC transporter substrate-binding protein [Breznakiella homolactica]QQO09443.1 sugar ABC transporter substrate-binding protein [Breznakiella homolactica]